MAANKEYIFKGNVNSVSNLPQIAEDKAMYYVISQRTYYAFNAVDKVWVTADTVPTWKNEATAVLDVSGSSLTVDNQYADTAGDAAKLGGYDASHYSVVGHTHVKADITNWAHTHAVNFSDGTNSGSAQTDTETITIKGTAPISTNFVDSTNTMTIDISLTGSNGISVNGGDISIVYGGNGSANTPARSDHTHTGDEITTKVASASDADTLSGHSADINATANTIMLRDANGNVSVNTITGSATNALALKGMVPDTTDTPSTIVQRDANGDFSAGTITATLNGTASNADKLDNLDSTQFLRSDTGESTFNISNNTGNEGQHVIKTIGNIDDTKSGLILFAKSYDGTTKLDKQGFEGTIYINRGNTTVFNISNQYDIICATAYESTKTWINGTSNAGYLVTTTYNNETWYGFYSPATSARTISIDGMLWGDPIFIPDASSYTVTKVNGGNTYINQYKVWHEGNDGAGSGLDADTLDSSHSDTSATANTIVKRDANGNVTANTFNGTLNGNASTANKWTNSRSISLVGDITGSTSVDGSADVSISSTIPNKSSANTPSTLVERDTNGDFSAGKITATIIGSADSLTTARNISIDGDATGSTSFNGTTDVTITATVNDSAKLGGKSPSTYEQIANKGAANGYASLDANTKIPIDQIPTTFASDIDMGNHTIHNVVTPVDPHDAANKDYVDAYMHGLEWQDSVKSLNLTAPPSSPTTGDRYIVAPSATGAWSGHDNEIAQYGTNAWQFIAVNSGTATWVENNDADYVFNGTSWIKFGSTINHNNTLGLQGGTSTERYHLTNSQYNDVANSTNANTPSTIVKRDANGNFAAGTITASVNGKASLNVLKSGDTMSGNINFSTDNTGLTLYGGGKVYKKAGESITIQPDKDSVGMHIDNTSGSTIAIIKTDGDVNGFTYYGNKVWHAGNDGSGSGLDADTLDGHDNTYFAPAQTSTYTVDTSDTQNVFTLNNTANHASTQIKFKSHVNVGSDYGYIRYDDDNNNYNKWGDTGENSAMIIGVENDGENIFSDVVALESPAGIFLNAPNVYVGDKNGGLVWNSNNDGSGSGLDADKLDGMQPSSSATANTIVQRDGSANINVNTINATNVNGFVQMGNFSNKGASTCTGAMPIQFYQLFPEKMQYVGNNYAPTSVQYTTDGSTWNNLTHNLTSFNTPPTGTTKVQQIFNFAHGIGLNALGILGSVNIASNISVYSSTDGTTWNKVSTYDFPPGQPIEIYLAIPEIWTGTTPYVKVLYTFNNPIATGDNYNINELRWYASYGGTSVIDHIDTENNTVKFNSSIEAPSISANVIGNLTGNSDTATKWQTARTVTLAGDVTGSTSIDGSSDVTINAAINKDSANTPSTIVQRDANGDFSAGTITATLNGTASNANTLQTHPASDFVLKSGDTMSGDLDVNSHSLTNVQEIDMTNTGVLKHGTSTVIDADGKVWGAVYNDIAEAFIAGEPLEAGDVVSYGPDGKVYKCRNFDSAVIGIVTDNPSVIMGTTKEEYESNPNIVLVAIAGRVPVKTDKNVAKNVRIGTLLSAGHNGTARIGSSMGSTIGKVLKRIDDNHVLAMVMLA